MQKKTRKVNKVTAYINETINELLHKVTWPSWNQLQESSVIVLVASLIIAFMIFLMDFVFGINGITNESSGWRGVLGFFYYYMYN